MSSPCLVMNRVGSIEPFENPSDTRKLESSSYHALGACLRPYNAFLRRPKSKNVKVRVNTEESAVKPEPELKNTIECNLYPSDGPGKPNSIFMKTVKTLKAKS
ncbi:hypothetical protein Tco_0930492 [Tanacetum coccineum]